MATPLVPFGADFDPLPQAQQMGFTPTSGYRTQAHQDDLRRQGLTQARTSQHTLGNAYDFNVPQGMTKRQARDWFERTYPGVRIADTNGDSIHVTFPDWGSAQDVSGSRRRYGG